MISSCPSTYTAWSFAAAAAITMEHKKWGIPAIAAAVIIGFSRLYLFAHFPTDVLFGAVLGVLFGIAAVLAVRLVFRLFGRSKAKKE